MIQYLMALVTELFSDTRHSKAHPTEVECGWQVINDGGRRLLQLSTYGSDQRQSEKKVSQTLQLDESMAMELVEIIRSTFPQLSR